MVKGSATSKGGKSAAVGKPPSGRSSSAERLATPAKAGKSGVAPRMSEHELSDLDDDETKDDEGWEVKPEPVEVEQVGELYEQEEDLQAFLGNSGAPRPIARNLASDLAEAGDDDDEGLPTETKLFEGNAMPRVPVDTPTANLLLGRLADQMRTESAWMMMFSPVPMAQATWINVWPAAKAPIDASSLQAVIRETQAFLKSIGFRCNALPSVFALEAWTPDGAGSELLRWKKRLRQAFEKEQETRVKKEARLSDLNEKARRGLIQPPSAPRKTKWTSPRVGETFRATVGSPYFEDSHMLPSPTSRDERVGGADSDSNSDEDLFDDSDDESPGGEKAQRPDPSYSKESRRAIEVRTHAPLRKIELFSGRRDRSEASMQWLKRFVYEMKGTKMPRDTWCEPFSLCLTDGAKSWYGQLPKKIQVKWSLLCEAFLDTYCSQDDQDPHMRYYHASRKSNEHVCDFLYRLNGYARKAKIQYSALGRVGKGHVEQFLLNCGDDDLADRLFPLGLDDIAQVERMVLNQLKGKRGQRQRDRHVSGGRARSRDDERRGESRRDDRRSKDGSRDRASTSRQESGRPRVLLADASRQDLLDALNARYVQGWDGSDSESVESLSSENELPSGDEEWINSATPTERSSEARYHSATSEQRYSQRPDNDRPADRSDRGTQRPSRQGYGVRRDGRRPDRSDRGDHRDGQETCASCGGRNHSAHTCWKRCKFCGQVHQPAQCELYQRFEKMSAILKAKADKGALPDDLKTALHDHLN